MPRKGRNCYGENKERLQNIARGRYKGLSKKEKHKKRGNVRNTRQTKTREHKKNQICSMSEEEIQQRLEQIIEQIKKILEELKS